MHIILIRHGKPDVPTTGPTANPPLSLIGLAQAEHAARALSHEPIARIVSSGMARADATARPLAETLDRPIDIVAEIGEIDRWGGSYASIETIRQQGGSEWQQFLSDPIGYFGIDPIKFRREVLTGFAGLFDHASATGGAGAIAVFTHGFPINILLSHALGIDHNARFVPSYASITRLAGRSIDALTVVSVNESGHVPEALK